MGFKWLYVLLKGEGVGGIGATRDALHFVL